METLTYLLFGTPERFRYSIYGFFIVGALVLGLAYKFEAYRRTILSMGAVMVILYSQSLFGILFSPADAVPPPADDPTGQRIDRRMAELREALPTMILFAGPFIVAAMFMIDRDAARKAKRAKSSSKPNGPRSNRHGR